MSELPDHSRSHAVLIGTSTYQDTSFPPLPAAARSLNVMRQVLMARELCGWPEQRITVLADPTDVRRLLQTLRRLARHTEDVLLVYFVGHGVILRRGQLCLTLADTESDDPDITGLEYQRVRDVLLESPARIKIVVLDCCYSGRAIEALSGNDIADYTDTYGVYTLTASDHAAHVVPLAQQQTTATSFTGELVRLIREGVEHGPEHLTLGTLYLHLRRRLHQRGLPAPNRRGTDTADQFPFTRNSAYQRSAQLRHPEVVVRRPATRAATEQPTLPKQPPVQPKRSLARYRLPAVVAVAVVIAAVTVFVIWNPTGTSSSTGCSYASISPAASSARADAPSGSATFGAMQRRGQAIIGVKEDQPGLGLREPSTGAYCGFDIEIAKLVAARLGFAADKIMFKTVASANREQGIASGTVDYYVGTYAITDKRKQQIAFAGPYFLAGQDLMVRKSDSTITASDKLKGRKVCSASGTVPIARVRDLGLTEPNNIVELPTYSQCVDKLIANEVDAVTTDDALLRGFAAGQPDALKVLGRPFSDEPYGIGLGKDDKALRDKVNDILQQALDDGTWQSIYDATLGQSGPPARKPVLQRY